MPVTKQILTIDRARFNFFLNISAKKLGLFFFMFCHAAFAQLYTSNPNEITIKGDVVFYTENTQLNPAATSENTATVFVVDGTLISGKENIVADKVCTVPSKKTVSEEAIATAATKFLKSATEKTVLIKHHLANFIGTHQNNSIFTTGSLKNLFFNSSSREKKNKKDIQYCCSKTAVVFLPSIEKVDKKQPLPLIFILKKQEVSSVHFTRPPPAITIA